MVRLPAGSSVIPMGLLSWAFAAGPPTPPVPATPVPATVVISPVWATSAELSTRPDRRAKGTARRSVFIVGETPFAWKDTWDSKCRLQCGADKPPVSIKQIRYSDTVQDRKSV